MSRFTGAFTRGVNLGTVDTGAVGGAFDSETGLLFTGAGGGGGGGGGGVV